jgi:hypothetical protein
MALFMKYVLLEFVALLLLLFFQLIQAFQLGQLIET